MANHPSTIDPIDSLKSATRSEGIEDAIKTLHEPSAKETAEKAGVSLAGGIFAQKALNPIIAMHSAMNEAQMAVNNSVRKERALDKSFRSSWETQSQDKSDTYEYQSWWKKVWAGTYSGLYFASIIASAKYGIDVGNSIQAFATAAKDFLTSGNDSNLQQKMTMHEYMVGLQKSLYDNGQASVQQLQRAVEEMRQKQLELIKLEGRAQGAPGGG